MRLQDLLGAGKRARLLDWQQPSDQTHWIITIYLIQSPAISVRVRAYLRIMPVETRQQELDFATVAEADTYFGYSNAWFDPDAPLLTRIS